LPENEKRDRLTQVTVKPPEESLSMTTVETTVTISINQNCTSFENIEQQIQEQLKIAGNELLQKVIQVHEEALLKGKQYQKCKYRGRYILTRFGWLRLHRWQVRDAQRNYFFPLDKQLELPSRQNVSPWVLQQSIALATRLPYRQATYLLGSFLEEDVDHRSLYRWVQKAGAKIITEEDQLQQEVFQRWLRLLGQQNAVYK